MAVHIVIWCSILQNVLSISVTIQLVWCSVWCGGERCEHGIHCSAWSSACCSTRRANSCGDACSARSSGRRCVTPHTAVRPTDSTASSAHTPVGSVWGGSGCIHISTGPAASPVDACDQVARLAYLFVSSSSIGLQKRAQIQLSGRSKPW